MAARSLSVTWIFTSQYIKIKILNMAIEDSPEKNENMHYSLTGIQIWEEALTIWVCLLAFYVFQGENEGLFLDVFLYSWNDHLHFPKTALKISRTQSRRNHVLRVPAQWSYCGLNLISSSDGFWFLLQSNQRKCKRCSFREAQQKPCFRGARV